MNLQTVLFTPRSGPKIFANAPLQNRIFPATPVAAEIIGASHHRKRAAILIQEVCVKFGRTDDRERSFGGRELLPRQQIRAARERVDMRGAVGLAELDATIVQ